MISLKESIQNNILNEMPRNYSFPPDATKEEKSEIRKKVGSNISDTMKRLDNFDKKVRDLIKDLDEESRIETEKIREEGTTRFGPFRSLGSIKSKLNDILVDIHKAKIRTANSSK